ncbi:MAG: nicotinamide riboside transporter PnuC [Arachidicoccus sp.]|nr:nicotinamide riboside transporter PnuC [Arachidicoccus sp.]
MNPLNFFDTHNTFITILGYQLSYIEFTGTCFGLLCVWLAAKENIWNWPAGLINIICFFIIFYQVRLYSDMFLQIYFFGISIYGWVKWAKQHTSEKPVTMLSNKNRLLVILIIIVSEIIMGFTIKNIHHILPRLFPVPAAFPFIDSFISVCSIVANILLAKRIIENWALWVLVDFICVFVYAAKHVLFISLEYGILFIIAAYGLYGWIKSYQKQISIS